ncbi:MAG: acyltransferase family protein [Acidimicrobiales bacterium]
MIGERSHVAALDGLRGVAVATVVAYHLRPDWVPGGFLGVDLFFVLSGYLITSLLLDEHARNGRIDLLAFAGRRLRRLLPAVLVVVVVATAYVAATGEFGEVERARRHALATLGYVANWVFIADGDSYFADIAGPSYFRHMWSLAIEEQFYLLWPGLVWLAIRAGGRRGVAVVAAAVAAASLGWMLVLHDGGDPSRVYFGTDTRIFEPLIGALVAVRMPLRAPKPVLASRAAIAGGLAWLVAVFVIDDRWTGFYEGGAAALAGLAVLTVVGATRPGIVANVLGWRPLVALGAISYAVYLWHWPLLLILRREGLEGVTLDVAVVAATLVISTLSLHLVESPVRSGAWLRGWRPVGVGSAAIAAVAFVVVVLTPTAVPADAVTADEVIASVTDRPVVSPPALPETETTTPPEPVGPMTVVLVGDSAAWTLGGGVLDLDTSHGPYVSPFDPDEIVLVNLARKGYRLVPGSTVDFDQERVRPPDDLVSEEWWRETVRTVRPDLVVALFGMSDLQSRVIDGVSVPFGSPEFADATRTAAAALLGDLADVAPVVILTTPPLIGDDMPVPVMAEFFDRYSSERATAFNRLLADIADSDPRFTLVDFASPLCPGSEGDGFVNGCVVDADGDPIRHDGVHFTTPGAERAAEILAPLLLDQRGSR